MRKTVLRLNEAIRKHMLFDPNILFIKTIIFLAETEIDPFEIRKLEFHAAETMTRKLIEIKAINVGSHEEYIFKNHYRKYISLSNKLGSQVAILTLLPLSFAFLAMLFYMHDLTSLLYQKGMQWGNQVAYSSSFVGSHEFVWGGVILLLWFYFIWKLFFEEIIILFEKNEKNTQESDQNHSGRKARSLEPARKRLEKILATLFLIAIFLAAWGGWTALSTYPSFTSRIYVLAGAVGIFMLAGLILSILSGMLFFALGNSILKRSIPDSIIVSKLGQLIVLLNTEPSIFNDLESITVKNSIIKSLEEITLCFSNLLPRKIRVRNAHEKALLEREFKKIANGFQSLQIWVYSPMSDTREALFSRLRTDFVNTLSGNYHDLPKIEILLSAEISSKNFLIAQANRWVNLLFRISLPFLILWIFELSPVKISPDAMDYLLIGSFAFSILIFVVEIDPYLGEKLAFLKNIQELLASRNKDF